MSEPDRIADMVEAASADQLSTIVCHRCGGSLQIQFTEVGKNALSIMCGKCVWRVVRNGLEKLPAWVGTIGGKFTTGQRY